MKHSKLMLLVLILACVLTVPGAKSGFLQDQVFTLTGRVKLEQGVAQNAQQAPPQITVRLYFPKDMKKPVLLAYLNRGGLFYFKDIPAGNYLLELYSEDQMFYQKAVTLSYDTYLDDKVISLTVGKPSVGGGEPNRVFDQTKLKQRNKVVLSGPEFQNKLTLSVGDIRSNGTLTIKIYEARGGRQIAKKDHRGYVYLEFSYNNSNYVVKGYPELGKVDYLHFEIYRKSP